MILDAFKGRGIGRGGGPRIGKMSGGAGPRIGMPMYPSPYICTWPNVWPSVGKNSPFKGIPLVGDIL